MTDPLGQLCGTMRETPTFTPFGRSGVLDAALHVAFGTQRSSRPFRRDGHRSATKRQFQARPDGLRRAQSSSGTMCPSGGSWRRQLKRHIANSYLSHLFTPSLMHRTSTTPTAHLKSSCIAPPIPVHASPLSFAVEPIRPIHLHYVRSQPRRSPPHSANFEGVDDMRVIEIGRRPQELPFRFRSQPRGFPPYSASFNLSP